MRYSQLFPDRPLFTCATGWTRSSAVAEQGVRHEQRDEERDGVKVEGKRSYEEKTSEAKSERHMRQNREERKRRMRRRRNAKRFCFEICKRS